MWGVGLDGGSKYALKTDYQSSDNEGYAKSRKASNCAPSNIVVGVLDITRCPKEPPQLISEP